MLCALPNEQYFTIHSTIRVIQVYINWRTKTVCKWGIRTALNIVVVVVIVDLMVVAVVVVVSSSGNSSRVSSGGSSGGGGGGGGGGGSRSGFQNSADQDIQNSNYATCFVCVCVCVKQGLLHLQNEHKLHK
jgi:hypothetical protein